MYRKTVIPFSILMVGSMATAAVVTLGFGPPHAALPVHWNAAGEVDKTAAPWIALLMMPVAAILFCGVMLGVHAIEPRRDSLQKSVGLFTSVWIGVLTVLAAAHTMVLCAAWNRPIDGVRLIVVAVGLLFVLLGNQLGKSRPMLMVGIRTPWTLADQDVWIATHRLGGKLMVAAGLFCFFVAVIGTEPRQTMHLMLVAVIASAAIPAIYSYFVWRRIVKNAR